MKLEELSIGNVVLFNGVPKVLQKEDFQYLYDFVDAYGNNRVRYYKQHFMKVEDGIEIPVDVEQYNVTPMAITEELLVNEQYFEKIGDNEYVLNIYNDFEIRYYFDAYNDDRPIRNIALIKKQYYTFLQSMNVMVEDFHLLQNALKVYGIQLRTSCYCKDNK